MSIKRLEIGHRGARLTKNRTIKHVENSLGAIDAALKTVDGVEIDVIYSNKTWWVSHDFNLSRFSSNETLKTATTDTILKQGTKESKLMTIEDLLKVISNQSYKTKKLMNIEIKHHDGKPLVDDCINLIKTVNNLNKNNQLTTFFSSFDFNLVETLKEYHHVGYLFNTLESLKQLKKINKNVFVITVQHNENTNAMLKYIEKRFGNLAGVYFSSEDDYFNNKENYTNVKVIYSEPFCE